MGEPPTIQHSTSNIQHSTFRLSSKNRRARFPRLPAKLIDQRPDVRAAESLLHSANAQVGVAIAARLPQFSITGAVAAARIRASKGCALTAAELRTRN